MNKPLTVEDPMTKITVHQLNRVLIWSNYLARDPNFRWTKVDAKVVAFILQEIQRIGHKKYTKSRLS